MNKLMTVVAVAFAFTAFAADNDGVRRFPRGNGIAAGERGPFQRGGFVPTGDSALLAVSNPKLAEEIGLSAEARDQIKKAEDAYRKGLGELQSKIHEAMSRQTELMKPEKPDEAAVMAAIDDLFDARKAMAKAQARRILVIKGQLTPEQLEKAKAAVRRDREERRGKRTSERRPARPVAPEPKAEGEAVK